MKFKVVYTQDENKINPSLENGLIDSGDMVVVDNGGGSGKIVFINENNEQVTISGGSGGGGPTDAVRYGI